MFILIFIAFLNLMVNRFSVGNMKFDVTRLSYTLQMAKVFQTSFKTSDYMKTMVYKIPSDKNNIASHMHLK